MRWPKAAAKGKIVSEEALLAHYDYPAEQHWRHLRKTNPIRVAFCDGEDQDGHHQGARQLAGGGGDDLLLGAQEGRRRRRLNGYKLVPLVKAGARFLNGELVERSE